MCFTTPKSARKKRESKWALVTILYYVYCYTQAFEKEQFRKEDKKQQRKERRKGTKSDGGSTGLSIIAVSIHCLLSFHSSR